MVEASLIWSIQAVDAEMKVEYSLAGDPGLVNRVRPQFFCLFFEAKEHQFGIFGHGDVYILLINNISTV